MIALAWLCVLLAAAPDASAPALTVAGALPRPAAFTLGELQALGPPVKANWVSPDSRRPVVGVALDRLLARGGLEPGDMGDDPAGGRKGWRRAVVVSAPDGFQAVFSLAELTPKLGGTRALLAWTIDGKPLPPDKGPLRLVVLTDKLPSRAVWAVNRIDVIETGAPPALARVAEVHGMAGPFAVAGYRMGQRALRELGLSAGSFDLEVRHESPAEVQWSCIADGAQAATGASPGKLNLRLAEVARPATRTVFRRKSTGKTVVLRLRPEFVRRFLDLPRADLVAAGAQVEGLKDDEIFSVEAP